MGGAGCGGGVGGGGRRKSTRTRSGEKKTPREGARGELVRVSLQSIGKNISARCAIARVRGRVGRGAVRRPRRGRGVERCGQRSRVVARTSSCRRRRRFRPRPRPRSRAPTHPRVCCWSRDPRAEEARVARERPRRRPRGRAPRPGSRSRGARRPCRSWTSGAIDLRAIGGVAGGVGTTSGRVRTEDAFAQKPRGRGRCKKQMPTDEARGEGRERARRAVSTREIATRASSRRARIDSRGVASRGGVSSRPPTGSRAGGRRTANRNAPLRRAQNFCLTTTARRRLRASPGAPPEPTRGLDPRADRARRAPRRVRSRRGCRRDTRAGNAGVAAADVSSRRRRRATAEPPSFQPGDEEEASLGFRFLGVSPIPQWAVSHDNPRLTKM